MRLVNKSINIKNTQSKYFYHLIFNIGITVFFSIVINLNNLHAQPVSDPVGYKDTQFNVEASNIESPDELKNTKTKKSQKSKDNKKMWNLDDVDLLALIGEMSRVTGRNFIIDPRVTGKASLISNEPMDDHQAYQAFLSILQVLGFTALESGNVTKIVPDSVAKQFDSKVNGKNLRDLGEEMIVQVIPVKNVSATALMPILRNLTNQQGHIAPYAPSNVIVIADRAANIAKIVEIISQIDKQGTDDVEIISLKDASADEIVKVLTNLTTGSQLGEGAAQQIKMAADLRTNSILLSGDKSKRAKMKALIIQMDVPTPRTGNTEVIYLKYQSANALVPVISGIVDAYYGTSSGSANYDSNMNRASLAPSGEPMMAGNYRNAVIGGNNTNSIGSTLQLPTGKREGNASAPGVRAEPNTNALVVTAPPELMRNIKAVIAQLDIRRFQVLVEALIVEVSLNHSQNLGIEWRILGGGGTSFPADASSPGIINALGKTAAEASNNLIRGLPFNGLTLGFLKGGDIRAILYALQQDSNTNILSTPSIVTMDNETAEIVVADKIPFRTNDVSSTASATTTGLVLRTSYDYKPVGLTLKITPMITQGEAVKLTIEQTQGSLRSAAGVDTPTTSERSIKTAVVVNDKDILVLGGLIESQRNAGESKVPILGDVPLLGELFKRRTDTLTKRNLMIFIRPVVIRDREESNNVSLSKYDYMRDSQLLYKWDPYSKIAKELLTELPDGSKTVASAYKLNLPDPF